MYKFSLALLVLAAACGETNSDDIDAGVTTDATIDAGASDAMAPDAFNACPGSATMEFGVVDWKTGDSVAGVLVEDGDGNSATSAPNGRVVLCVPQSGDISIEFTHDSYFSRVHSTTADHVIAQFQSGVAPSFGLIHRPTIQELYKNSNVVLTTPIRIAIVMVTDSTSGAERADVGLALSADHDGAFTPSTAPNTLVSGSTTGPDGRVVFLNVDPTSPSTTVSVTGGINCIGPTTIALEAVTNSVAIRCD